MKKSGQLIAKAICDVNVVKFGDFMLASGRRSPVYIDLRILPSFPEQFGVVIGEMAKLVKKLGVDVIAGAETAGIPLAAAIAIKAGIPMVYVRKRPKDYGTRSQIEGILNNGNKAVLIDDLITDGNSKIGFVEGIKRQGGIIEDILVILDREQGGKEMLEKNGLKLHSLIRLKELLGYMKENNLVTEEKFNEVMDYLEKNVSS